MKNTFRKTRAKALRSSKKFLYIFALNFSSPDLTVEGCKEWFRSGNVNPAFTCTYDCMFIKTNSTTGHCPVYCPDLCELDYGGVAFFNLSGLYLELNMSERAIVADQPKLAIRAYANSYRAEMICLRLYSPSRTNDESDACRHYIWAGLLSCGEGVEAAQKILNAHEDTSDQPIEERAMDLANNRAGILAGSRLQKSDKCDGDNLLKEFERDLDARVLVVLKSRRKK